LTSREEELIFSGNIQRILEGVQHAL
jgi:hypothetical protein